MAIRPVQRDITPVLPNTKITRLAFLNRFTTNEAVAIDLASYGETVEAATVRHYMSKVNASQFIDLTRQDLIDGVHALGQAGLLTSERVEEILNAPIQDVEVYRA